MDPAGLLLSLATIAYTLDEISESYSSASSTLSLINSQIRILEAGTQRIQEWLHHTDPQSRVQLMASLGDAIGTVNSSLERLQDDVASLSHTGPKTTRLLGKTGSNQWAKTKFVYNEGRLRKHLTDVRECAHLMHFTLNVCQLPHGQTAAQEVRELSLGAKALHRAQTSARRERRSVLQEPSTAKSELHSDDFNAFVTSVMAAEAELPEESPVPTRQASTESWSTDNDFVRQLGVETSINDPNELFLPTSASPAIHQTADRNKLGVPQTVPSDTDGAHLRPDHPERLPSHNTLFREINSMLGETSPERSASPPPNIPMKSSQRVARRSSTMPETSTTPRPQIKRKPLSRNSLSGELSMLVRTLSRDKSAQLAPDSGSSSSLTASPASSILDKLTPLTESLRSLSSSDYVNVELDRRPVQPYADTPPAYQPSSPRSPVASSSAVPRARRRGTGGSSLSRNVGMISVAQYVRESQLELISALLKDGYSPNETDNKGVTPLMEAARYRRWDAAKLLLKSGARLHLRDVDGNTALHHAAQEGDTEMCQMLLDAGTPAEDCNKKGLQPLQLAVAGGHTEAVLCLVNAVPFRKTNDEALVVAFLSAVRLGDTPTAQAILAKGVKPKRMKESWRMVGCAAQSGSLPMLELVLNEKASLKDRSPAGYSPLHFAALHGHQPMVEKLLALKVPWKAQTKKAGEAALHMAIAAGHTSTALALIAHKDANVTIQDADNQEPIHHAVRKGDTKVMVSLLEQGAKLSSANKYGWKTIHLAAAYGHTALLAECMTRGISVEEKLMTPSFKPEKRTNQAARRGYWAEIRWPHAGSRPLHLALEFGHDEVARMLISGGAKLEETDSRGWRPLHMAAWSCRSDLVELLVMKGVSVEAKTIDGHTPLTLGFRAHGLTTDEIHRRRIYDTLSMATAYRKPSMLRQLTSFVSNSPSDSKTAQQRNLAWHTAQLAESLYQQPNTTEEGVMDDMSESWDGSEIGVALSNDMGRSQEDIYDVQPGSSRVRSP
ncbi:hypothetical protein LTR56_026125 [Elasticomyces elasticus]|nr:hypothetical protein LTR56_026125 [Elasticomyces elasticus]KAK3618802.1 hypothetical protein LTR22_026233 [Elasticomyces elasticus]KAK4903748.1 hypothetical protein LTR49_026673 [Elasticomyces elasticus]KAK5737964.1 hypothetical protein LTS12_025742 [Elasticomyces elasticus]